MKHTRLTYTDIRYIIGFQSLHSFVTTCQEIAEILKGNEKCATIIKAVNSGNQELVEISEQFNGNYYKPSFNRGAYLKEIIGPLKKIQTNMLQNIDEAIVISEKSDVRKQLIDFREVLFVAFGGIEDNYLKLKAELKPSEQFEEKKEEEDDIKNLLGTKKPKFDQKKFQRQYLFLIKILDSKSEYKEDAKSLREWEKISCLVDAFNDSTFAHRKFKKKEEFFNDSVLQIKYLIQIIGRSAAIALISDQEEGYRRKILECKNALYAQLKNLEGFFVACKYELQALPKEEKDLFEILKTPASKASSSLNSKVFDDDDEEELESMDDEEDEQSDGEQPEDGLTPMATSTSSASNDSNTHENEEPSRRKQPLSIPTSSATSNSKTPLLSRPVAASVKGTLYKSQNASTQEIKQTSKHVVISVKSQDPKTPQIDPNLEAMPEVKRPEKSVAKAMRDDHKNSGKCRKGTTSLLSFGGAVATVFGAMYYLVQIGGVFDPKNKEEGALVGMGCGAAVFIIAILIYLSLTSATFGCKRALAKVHIAKPDYGLEPTEEEKLITLKDAEIEHLKAEVKENERTGEEVKKLKTKLRDKSSANALLEFQKNGFERMYLQLEILTQQGAVRERQLTALFVNRQLEQAAQQGEIQKRQLTLLPTNSHSDAADHFKSPRSRKGHVFSDDTALRPNENNAEHPLAPQLLRRRNSGTLQSPSSIKPDTLLSPRTGQPLQPMPRKKGETPAKAGKRFFGSSSTLPVPPHTSSAPTISKDTFSSPPPSRHHNRTTSQPVSSGPDLFPAVKAGANRPQSRPPTNYGTIPQGGGVGRGLSLNRGKDE